MKSFTTSRNAEFIRDMTNSTMLDDAVDWIEVHLTPDDVFTHAELEEWALDNGFIAKED